MKIVEVIPILLICLIFFTSVLMAEAGTTLVIPPWNHCLGLHRVTQFHLNLYSGYSERFNDPQGLFCVKLNCEDDPETERDDDELTVFGLNTGNHKIIYNKGLTSIGIVGGLGKGLLEFNKPLAVSGDRWGNIYVADTGNNRLVHLRYIDDELAAVKEIKAPEEKSLDTPSGVSLSGGVIYATDTGNNRITVFDTSGSFIGAFRPRLEGAELYRPTSVAAVSRGDGWLYYQDYYLAVVDSFGQRLWKVSQEGRATGIVRYKSMGVKGEFNHVAIDYYGNIYVTDSKNCRIHKFDRHLNYIIAIGEKGSGEMQFDEPRGITIYRRFGQVFISERGGAQYYWIGTDLLRLSADGLAIDLGKKCCSVNVSFLLTEHSIVSLFLEDMKGNKRIAILDEHFLPACDFENRITVHCDDGESLAKCKLRLVAVAKPTYSSKAFLSVTRTSRVLEPIVNPSTPSSEM